MVLDRPARTIAFSVRFQDTFADGSQFSYFVSVGTILTQVREPLDHPAASRCGIVRHTRSNQLIGLHPAHTEVVTQTLVANIQSPFTCANSAVTSSSIEPQLRRRRRRARFGSGCANRVVVGSATQMHPN